MNAFLDWVGTTRLSIVLGEIEWAIPGIQAVHIMMVTIVFCSAFLMDMKLLGVGNKNTTFPAMMQRFAPWIFWAIVVLIGTGLLLMIAEPTRAILNKYFQLKMLCLVIVSVLTAQMAKGSQQEGNMWANPEGNGTARMLAIVSLLLWGVIVTTGRFIAYIS